MNIQRLNWAGIRVEAHGTAIAVDPFSNVNTDLFGMPREALMEIADAGAVDAVFVTHLHSDHFDPLAITNAYGCDIPVYVPFEVLDEARQTDLTQVHGVKVGEAVQVGRITVMASHAVDGLGDSQVSWIIQGDGRTLIHSGDTLWHGHWWAMAKAYGPFDAAFLPVNAPVLQERGMTASGEPIAMTPEQAVSAACVLGAKQLVPIHFGTFHNPPAYVATGQEIERLKAAAREKGIEVQVRRHGEPVTLNYVEHAP